MLPTYKKKKKVSWEFNYLHFIHFYLVLQLFKYKLLILICISVKICHLQSEELNVFIQPRLIKTFQPTKIHKHLLATVVGVGMWFL